MMRAYARSKLALLIMSQSLARRLETEGITVTIVHPGLVRTDILRHGGLAGLVWKTIGLFSLSPRSRRSTPASLRFSRAAPASISSPVA